VSAHDRSCGTSTRPSFVPCSTAFQHKLHRSTATAAIAISIASTSSSAASPGTKFRATRSRRCWPRMHSRHSLRHGRDLIRFLLGRHLAERQATAGRPRATRCSGDFCAARSKERHSAFPSIAIASRAAAAKSFVKRRKQTWNCARSSRRNTRLKVSWLGMPRRSRRNWRRNLSFVRPHNACRSRPPLRTAWRRGRLSGSRADHAARYPRADPLVRRNTPQTAPRDPRPPNPLVRIHPQDVSLRPEVKCDSPGLGRG
jgi:hypothetical protein